jgi:hypothetical protein
MENTKVYLGLIAVWAMVAWMAWEFAWDAWQNARRTKRQRQTIGNERNVRQNELRETEEREACSLSGQKVGLG